MKNCKECYYNTKGCEMARDADKCESYLHENLSTLSHEKISKEKINSDRLINWTELELIFTLQELESYTRINAVTSMMANNFSMAIYYISTANNYHDRQKNEEYKQ